MAAHRPDRRNGPAPQPRVAVNPGDPLVLAVDTSGPVEGIALVQGELVLGSWSGRRPGRSGSGLVGRIQQVFEWGGRDPSQLSAVAGVVGPGAFTGLRVGIATLRGMASGLSVPSFSYRSDEAWAAAFPGSRLPVAMTLDARRKEVYSALLSVDLEGRSTSIDPVRLQAPTAWFEYLAAEENCSGGVRLVGDGALLYRESARSILGDRAVFTGVVPAGAAVSWMARDAVLRLASGDPGGETLRPLYLRDHDAALKARAASQSS